MVGFAKGGVRIGVGWLGNRFGPLDLDWDEVDGPHGDSLARGNGSEVGAGST